jgi:PAS domain S-box-containing protein
LTRPRPKAANVLARALGCVLFLRQAPSPAVTVSIGASWAMETTLSRKWTKSRTRGRKLHLTEAKARVGRARKTRADLERQLKACKREIANARERLIEATKQQTATSEMLRIISDSPLQSVLDAVAEHAARLCDSNHAEIYRLENNLIRLVAAYGDFPVHSQAREGFPVNRDRVIGRTICDRRSVHVHDLAAEDSEYPSGSSDAKRLGHRTTLGTPLLRERTPIGGILFRRFEVRPFSDNQIALLESFADQAAIAIENVRLFEAEKQRTLALAQANRDLAEREAKIRRLVDANIIGVFTWHIVGRTPEDREAVFKDVNDTFFRLVGYEREELIKGSVGQEVLTAPEYRDRTDRAMAEMKLTGSFQPYEKEYIRKDGSRVPVLIGGATFEGSETEGVAFVLDLTERKRAEEALRASEERFRDYVDVASDWFWETGPDHRFTEFSRSAADWGLSQVLIGKKRWDLAGDREEEPEKWRAHIATLEARQPFRGFKYKIPHPDGSARYVSVSGKPVLDGSGAFLGYRGVATDVSAEVWSEKALRDSEERFRTLMQFSFDVYWETDAQHRFIRQDYSEGVTDGPSLGSELGKRRWEVPHLEIDEEAWRKHREILDAHLPFRDLEYARPTPNGGKRWEAVSGLPMFDEAGRFIGYRGVGRHITERKQIEEALRQREKELREIVETIPAMTVTITADGRDAFIGKRFSEYSGLSEEDARGSGWKVTVHPDDLDLYLRSWRPSLISGDPVEFETRVRRADGEYRWFLARAVAQKDEHGNILKWYEVLTDIEDRKRAEAVLRERETRIRRLFDANIIGILISDFEGSVVEANDAFLGIVGYGRDDLIAGRINLGDMTPPEWRELQERSVEEMNSSGTMPSREKEYFRKDGSRVPVLVGGAGLEEGGKQSVGFVLDLTERKRAEAVLRESEARVRHLIDANIIGIFIGDFDGNIVDANDTYLRLLGYDREDLLSGRLNWATITPPELLYRSERALQEMKSVGKARLYEKEYIRKDGSRVPALVGATIFGEGRGLGFVLDLTEQKRAETALRESEEQWKAIFENNPTMYFMVDATDTILSVNPFGAEQLGYTTNELIGRPVETLFHRADRESALRNKQVCLEHIGRTMSWELRKLRKNGEALWVRETARAMLIKNRPVVLVVSEDITEVKRAAEALRDVQTELAHANRVATMGQLTASIAHEVSQPIGGAAASAHAALNWLTSEPPNLEAARRSIERAIRDTKRAGDVIGRVRDIIKKAPPRRDRFNINEAIREVVELIRSEAVKNGIAVRMDIADGLPLLHGDRVQLQQVIINLIVNAIEAMKGAGEGARDLVISTRKAELGILVVAVKDSGPGLAPADSDRLFEAFYTTKAAGLGLGLSICRSIIEAHEGRMSAANNAGPGATFQFTLRADNGDS